MILIIVIPNIHHTPLIHISNYEADVLSLLPLQLLLLLLLPIAFTTPVISSTTAAITYDDNRNNND